MSDLFNLPDLTPNLQDFIVEWAEEPSEKGLFGKKPGDYTGGTRIGLPPEKIDCYVMESLGEHEAVDPIIRQELQRGVPFRLIRIPCSIAPGPDVTVTKARVTTTLKEDGAPRAQIYSIFPVKLEAEGESQREISIGPSLEIVGKAKLSGFTWVKRLKVSQPRSLVTGFWFPNTAEWILEPVDDALGLAGTWNFLFTLRGSGDVRPLNVAVRIVIEATPRNEGLLRTLFLRSKDVRHTYGTWDPATCSDAM